MFNIRYASIRNIDISNGNGVGISIFVQGCQFCCKNCFNSETWDFNGGKEWTQEVEDKFIELANRPYIKRISILGGEPLAEQNLDGVLNLVDKMRLLLPNKTIWLYTGFSWEDIWNDSKIIIDDFTLKVHEDYKKRQQIISQCDVLVDGRYIESKRDLTLKFRGSSNQRLIDVKKSLENNQVVLYDI